MKFLFFLLFSFVGYHSLSAQEVINTYYKGTINGRSVRMYIRQEENPCGGNTGYLYTAIYQYGVGKNWIELDITENRKSNFCLTEYAFTGVLILKKTDNTFNGTWISPDGQKQFKVLLELQALPQQLKKQFDEHLDRVHYENHDC